jgi:hypothetical protein
MPSERMGLGQTKGGSMVDGDLDDPWDRVMDDLQGVSWRDLETLGAVRQQPPSALTHQKGPRSSVRRLHPCVGGSVGRTGYGSSETSMTDREVAI